MTRSSTAPSAYVWTADLTRLSDAALDAAARCLDASEIERANGFEQGHRRRQFLASRALLRGALSALAPVEPSEWRFRRTALGQPVLAPEQRSRVGGFSLSHCASAVAVAIAPVGRVGVDVERRSRAGDVDDVAYLFLNGAEQDGLTPLVGADRSEALLALWSAKEAFSKAVGRGLQMDFRTVALGGADEAALDAASLSADAPTRLTLLAHPADCGPRPDWRWRIVVERSDPDHVLACAYEAAEAGRLEVRREGLSPTPPAEFR